MSSSDLSRLYSDKWNIELPYEEKQLKVMEALQRVIDSKSEDPDDQPRIAAAFYDTACITMGGYKSHGSNPKKANELWFKAAAMGHPQAARNLGTSFRLGNGLPKDELKSEEWYQRSVELEKKWPEEFDRIIYGKELETYEEGAVAAACGVSAAEAKAVLKGNAIEDREKMFKVLDWMLAIGKIEGPKRIAVLLGGLAHKLRGASIDEVAPDYGDEFLQEASKNAKEKGDRCTNLEAAAEIAWILGSNSTTPAAELADRATAAAIRYLRLHFNMEIVGGHVKPVSESGIDKRPLLANLECISCGRTANQAGLENLKRCTTCKSVAAAFCSRECLIRDFSGDRGIHGVALARRGGSTGCKQMAAAIARFRA